MKLVLRLVETGIDGSSRSVDVLEIVGRSDPGDIAALGVTLSQGKQLLGLIQREVVAAQCRELAIRRPSCRSCEAVCQLKDYRPRQIATLFGQVTVRLPRFRCAGCGTMEAAVDWPARCRSTPELDQLPGPPVRPHALSGRGRRARAPSAGGSVSFRGKLRSAQGSDYPRLYQATEIRSRSAATRWTWMTRRRASETFWLM